MNPCERFEESLSALIDGELEPVELRPTADHLADCDACRTFYQRARALEEALLERASPGAAPAAPEHVWRRIRAERAASPVAGRRPARWAPLVAAGLLLAVGLWATLSRGGPARSAGHVEVIVAGAPERMSEERFVALTTELLQADPRYHRKMLEVMSVVAEPGGGEGRREGRRVRAERNPLREALDESRREGDARRAREL
jgi:predicted anti-sigma-YlaC factor YlaD